jgi:hypothetical protein
MSRWCADHPHTNHFKNFPIIDGAPWAKYLKLHVVEGALTQQLFFQYRKAHDRSGMEK